MAAKFYDPIRFISPVIVRLKLLFQDLCSNVAEWNDTSEGQLRVKWNKLVVSLQNSWPLRVERCYFKEPRNEMVWRDEYLIE